MLWIIDFCISFLSLSLFINQKDILQFNQLFSNCPEENSSGVYELNIKNQEAILSIGVYYIESNFQYEDKILSYLLRISKCLPKAVWVDPPKWLDKDSKYSVSLHFLYALWLRVTFRDSLIFNLQDLDIVTCLEVLGNLLICFMWFTCRLLLIRFWGIYENLESLAASS